MAYLDEPSIQQLRKYNLDKYARGDLSERYMILLKVLAEEIKVWDDTAYFLLSEIYELEKKAEELNSVKSKQKKWRRFVYNRLLNQPTPIEDEVEEINNRLKIIKKKLNKHYLNEPNIVGYELALLGNKIFGVK